LHVDRVDAAVGMVYVPNFSGENSLRVRIGKIKKEMEHTM